MAQEKGVPEGLLWGACIPVDAVGWKGCFPPICDDALRALERWRAAVEGP